jgi:hypothetical protein
MPYGKRSFNVGPWHYCARCDEKTHIAEMVWQRGKLLCPECLDVGTLPLQGQRDMVIQQVLTDGQKELEPNIKLREPLLDAVDDDIFQ